MEHITFEINNRKDLNLLITIAEKLGLKKFFFTHKISAKEKPEEFSELMNIIDKGVDISNFGDVNAWQKNVRTNRKIHPGAL